MNRKPAKPKPPAASTGLGTPQFDLRTMLIVMGCICTILAVHVRFGALAASAVTLSILAIGAHVAANAIGTKLRDHRGDERSVAYNQRPELSQKWILCGACLMNRTKASQLAC